MTLHAAMTAARPAVAMLGGMLLAAHHHPDKLVHLLLSFGMVGLFLVSIVDSSFVPLPVPGITDLMIVVMAAQHANLFFLVLAASAGSALGGYFSYQVGQHGGMAFLEKHVPRRIFKRVTQWMETHAILSVAVPAVLPPPMPLSPFVLAAGALRMSRRKFFTTFTVSRALRHAAAAGIGVYYGPHVLHLWNMFTRKYAVPILSTIWGIILISVGFAFWKIYKTSRSVGATPQSSRKPSRPAAPAPAAEA